MSRKIIAFANLLSVIILIAWNGYANTGNYNGNTVGDLSAEYNNLFTPASYAFSIWGVIFLALVIYGIYGIYIAFAKADPKYHAVVSSDQSVDFLETTYPYFSIANLLCTLWVGLWLSEQIAYSVICMVGILIFLLLCIGRLNMERWDAPFPIIAFVWWPLCFYSGWIGVALVASTASYLNNVFDISHDTQVWVTAAMIVVIFLIYSAMIWKRNMREFAIVGAWALIALYVRHTEDIKVIAYTAIASAALILIQTAAHGIKNHSTNPGLKFREWIQGE